jgi:predicted nucleic acid-binding protein
VLLDTDILIDVQRAHPSAVAWFAGLQTAPLLPGFVAMELVQDAQNTRQVQQVLKLISPLPIVWPSEADCSRAFADFTALHLSHGLGLLDALIASCAIGLSMPLCTFNVKHFRVVPGLQLLQPYTR